MRRLLAALSVLIGTLTLGLVTAPMTAVVAGAATPSAPIYDSTDPGVGHLPSLAYEATAATEIGNQVQFAPGSSQTLDNVVVSLESWGCGTSGTWYGADCVTTPGATFDQPITVNLYAVNPDNSPGALLTSVTQTVSLAYRPSADDTNCTGDQAGKWYDAATSACYTSILDNATIDMGDITVPSKVIYGIEIRTSDYGDPVIGGPLGDATACHSTSQGCPYDSLNVALSLDPTNVVTGSDPVANGLYWNTSYGPNYCDGGASGTGTFRLDSGCWGDAAPYTSSPYDVPAVQFNAVATTPAITSANAQTIYQGTIGNSFTVTASGWPAPTLSETGTLPAGITFDPATGVLSGTTHVFGSFPVTFSATNIGGTGSQAFTLTVLPAVPVFSSPNTGTLTVGQSGSVDITVNGAPSPTVTEKGKLPSGVSLASVSPGHYQLTGTPAAGTGKSYLVTLTATSTSGKANQKFHLVIDQAPGITSANHNKGTVGKAFNFVLRGNGFPKPTFSSPDLPPGVTITNLGNGKATLAGHYLVGALTFTVVASNGVSPDATQTFTMTGD